MNLRRSDLVNGRMTDKSIFKKERGVSSRPHGLSVTHTTVVEKMKVDAPALLLPSGMLAASPSDGSSKSSVKITQPSSSSLSSSTSSTSPSPASTPSSWAATAGRDAAAGALSGAFARTVTAPIERVKLILQLQNSAQTTRTTISNTATTATTTTPSSAHNTAWGVTQHIYQTEGLLAFWRGNLQNVLRAAGQAALNFALMDYYKGLAQRTVPTYDTALSQNQSPIPRRDPFVLPNWMVSFVAGGLAGGTATTVLYPTEFLRTRLALDSGRLGPSSSSSSSTTTSTTMTTHRQYRGMMDAVRQIVRVDGISGIYQGFGISLVGSVIYRLVYLGGYDVAKNEVVDRKKQKHLQHDPARDAATLLSSPSLTWTERFWLAQVVSLTAGTLCYPIDSVRRRMMMQAGRPLDLRLYSNSLQCFWRIWQGEGLRGFYLGIGPNLVRSFGGALALVAYDGFKGVLAPNNI